MAKRILTQRWIWITLFFGVLNIGGLAALAWKIAPRSDSDRPPEEASPFVPPCPDVPIALRPFAIEEAEGHTPATGEPYIRIGCTEPPKANKVKDYIRIAPALDIRVTPRRNHFTLCGRFQPGHTYRIACLKGMPGANGQRLATDSIRRITIPDRPPRLKFLSRGVYLMAEGRRVLPLETLNVKRFGLTVSKAYANNLIHYLDEGRSYRASRKLGRTIVERTITTEMSGKNAPVTTYLDLGELLAGEAAGAYYIRAKAGDSRGPAASQVVLMSDLGISVKRGKDDLTIWVVALSTGNPVAGAAVKIFSRKNQEIASGIADETGVWEVSGIDLSGERTPFALLAEKDGDVALMRISECRVGTSAFPTAGRPYLRDGYEAYAYTDRSIYRPGETAHVNVIVRSSNCSLPGEFPARIRITRPDGRTWKELGEPLSPAGTIHADLPLPPDAQTGRYRATALLPGDERSIGSVSFQVEEFMPDRLKAAVTAQDEIGMPGQDILFNVSGSHLFGAPASGRRVTATFRVANREFRHPDWKGYAFRDSEKSFAGIALDAGENELDPDGACTVKAQVPNGLKTPSAAALVCTATVHEVGGRGVSATAACRVDPYPRYAGIRKTTPGWPELDEEISFGCALVRPDGTPVEAAELSACVYRVWWQSAYELDGRGHYRYRCERMKELALGTACVIVDGRGGFSFTPEIAGEYETRVTDAAGGASANLSFYCSADGSVPWDMRYPDRLEIVLDKETYEPGETAHVVIKTPFGGTALFTVETDRVRLRRVIRMDGNTAAVAVPVDASWGANAYCSATVIHRGGADVARPLQRAFGVAPIRIDTGNRRLAIAIEAPETQRPDDPFTVGIRTLDASNAPVSCEVTLAAVDEGICRLMPFRIPDPFGFFFTQRRLGVATHDMYSLLMPEFDRLDAGSDSEPGGGYGPERNGSYDPSRFNPIRADRVKPVALWSGPLLTDENGRATATFELPPAFNGRLRLIAVAVDGRRFGSAEDWVTVKAPLMLRTALPRFLAPADEFVLPVTVFNNTGASRRAAVSVAASEGIHVEGAAEQFVDLIAERDASVFFRLKSPGAPGVAKINVTAAAAGETVSEKTEIAVRPPAPRQTLCGAGRVRGGDSADIVLPDGWLAGTQKFRLVCSARPGLELLGGLRYVMKYPHGCLEQTTSRCFPLLYLSDLAEAEGSGAYTKEEVHGFVAAGIERILDMQTTRGSFSTWPGHYDAYTWGSAYATHFLVEAQRAGYDVPDAALGRALDALEKILPDNYGGNMKAYTCYVLANAGRSEGSWAYRLYEGRERLSASARFHVAAALALSDEKELAKELIYAPLPPFQTERETGGTLNSPVREKAVLLSACLDADPENPRTAAWAEDLTASMKNGRWLTTQDNAFALMALGKYFRAANRKPDNWTAEVRLGEGETNRFTHLDTLDRSFADPGRRRVHLSVSGEGALNFYWSAEGVPLAGKVEARDRGIAIRRTFTAHDGKRLSPDAIPLGELVLVNIEIRARNPVDNVVITDLLPACFEIENPRLATSQAAVGRTRNGYSMECLRARHVERRDDRLLVFTNLPGDDARTYRYAVRAVTEGRFTLPPVEASCMYNPEISGLTGAGNVRVIRGE